MVSKIAVIVGGYLGDEGKGKATCELLDQYSIGEQALCVRAGGGTNTGATIYRGDKKIEVHMVPVGAFMENGAHAYIGSGVYVNLKILVDELALMRDVCGGSPPNKVFISRNAHIVFPQHIKEDEAKEEAQKLGSTKNGVSIAAQYKYGYNGITMGMVEQNIKDYPTIADHFSEVIAFGARLVDPYEFFTETVMPGKWNIVVEGTQGVGLDVNHGFHYPYVSAGSFSTFGILDGVGYALAPTEVIMVLKAYGSYFGPKRMRGHFEDDDFRNFAGEYGTTSGRPRNLCWLDAERLRVVSSVVRPTSIMVNCLDSLNWFAENRKTWSIMLDEGHSISFEDRVIVDGKLTKNGHMFINTLEEYCDAKVNYLGIGPKTKDLILR